MATVDILVPSPLSFNGSCSDSKAAALYQLYSNGERPLSEDDAGYSSPEETSPPAAVGATSSNTSGDEEQRCGITEEQPQAEDQESLMERARRQVEWYFSDENLQKDSFLMKHITRNKQGYVSLKLVASLRKVKSITKDWKVVLSAVQSSTLLQVNEEGTKIRRLEAAPKVDYSHLPKTLLVTNYPNQDPDESDVRDEFGRYGNVRNVLFLHPGRAIPLDVKSCRSKFPSIGKESCILVEYESISEAKKAFKTLSQNWRQTMNVQILSASVDTETKGANLDKRHQQKIATEPAGTNLNKVSPTVRKIVTKTSRVSSGYDSGYTGNSRSPSLSPMPSPAPSRKFFADSSSTTASPKPRLTLLRESTSVPVIVVRLPYGPDGTTGFH